MSAPDDLDLPDLDDEIDGNGRTKPCKGCGTPVSVDGVTSGWKQEDIPGYGPNDAICDDCYDCYAGAA